MVIYDPPEDLFEDHEKHKNGANNDIYWVDVGF
jgi:hypothetical protein